MTKKQLKAQAKAMDYPAWRISFQSSEQAARAAFNELLIVKGLLAETRANAERYRWLRENGMTEQDILWDYQGESLDTYLDAQMEEETSNA